MEFDHLHPASAAAKYFRRNAQIRELEFIGNFTIDSRTAVVIPAFHERETLPETLKHLERAAKLSSAPATIVVVINNPPPENDPRLIAGCENNRKLLHFLRQSSFSFSLALIDASTPGNELPAKNGVGMARKIGCDSILAHFLSHRIIPEDIRLLHLDADTHVEENYFPSVLHAMAEQEAGSAVIAFRHRMADNPNQEAAIRQYESYLNYYKNMLKYAGSPYAFHTVGSTMVCRGNTYITVGGIPSGRLAGEDFYFLQKLAKVAKLIEITATTVHPSARVSNRVPFGTGPRITEALATENDRFPTYHPAAFEQLKGVIETVNSAWNLPPETLLKTLPVPTQSFFTTKKFTTITGEFRKRLKTREAFLDAFHNWFDGFATLKLIHHLTATNFPKIPLEEALQITKNQPATLTSKP